MKLRLPVLFLCLFFFALSFSDVKAASSVECGGNVPSNTATPVRVGIIVLGSSSNPQRSATIAVGESVRIDATPRDASNDMTQVSNIEWLSIDTAISAGLISARGTNCFTPTITALKDGVVNVTAVVTSMDGNSRLTSETFTVTIGSGGTTVGGTDDEKYEYCAYLDTNGRYTCILDSRDDAKCDSTAAGAAICTVLAAAVPSNKCVRKEQEQCSPDAAPPQGLASPSFPLLPPQEPPADLGALITSIFNWSLAIVGIAVFVMILYGGATWLVAAGSPALVSKAKETIRNALLGAFLLFSAYLILNTINPDFVRQSTTLEPLRLPGDVR
ncbi:MAG: pilin [Candidatus Yanofskybacteria bacterium]|nr:pilin [Candidatus Yanofskybacteria bacterium]